MADNFKEIGSLFGREGAGAGFAKQTDKESFTYAFAWPEGDTWATLTGYLNLDEQPATATLPSGKKKQPAAVCPTRRTLLLPCRPSSTPRTSP